MQITFGICCFYVLFGCTCTAALGSSLQTVLTSSLDQTSGLTVAIQLAYVTAILCTFPLQMFPVYSITRSLMYKCGVLVRPPRGAALVGGHSMGCDAAGMKENVTRLALVCTMALVAIMEPQQLGHIVSLCGSLCGIPIGFIFPPAMHFTLTRETASRASKAADLGVLLVGVVMLVFTTTITVRDWNKPNN